MAEERIAPLLAVGDHVDAGRDLALDRLVHGPVLDLLEPRVVDLARV